MRAGTRTAALAVALAVAPFYWFAAADVLRVAVPTVCVGLLARAGRPAAAGAEYAFFTAYALLTTGFFQTMAAAGGDPSADAARMFLSATLVCLLAYCVLFVLGQLRA